MIKESMMRRHKLFMCQLKFDIAVDFVISYAHSFVFEVFEQNYVHNTI